jgi:putative cell wall-binding protein
MKRSAKFSFIFASILMLTTAALAITTISASGSTQVTRLYGQDRYVTATKIADALAVQFNLNFASGDKFDNVVLASGNNYPDALSGAPLARSLKAPILLLDKTPEDSQITWNYLESHVRKSGKIILLGGTGVIPGSFKNQLLKMGFYKENIYQYGGKDRHETSLIIAKALNSKPHMVTLVSSGNFYDAMTVATLSAANKAPILLISPTGLTAEQKQYLDKAVSDDCAVDVFGEITNTVAGQNIRDKYPEAHLFDLLGNQIFHTNELNRYANNSLWAHLTVSVYPSPIIYLATGEDYPDALTGAVYASGRYEGYYPGFILLTKPNELPAETIHVLNHIAYYAKLASTSADDRSITLDPIKYPQVVIFGGPGAVSYTVGSQVQSILNSSGFPKETGEP